MRKQEETYDINEKTSVLRIPSIVFQHVGGSKVRQGGWGLRPGTLGDRGGGVDNDGVAPLKSYDSNVAEAPMGAAGVAQRASWQKLLSLVSNTPRPDPAAANDLRWTKRRSRILLLNQLQTSQNACRRSRFPFP